MQETWAPAAELRPEAVGHNLGHANLRQGVNQASGHGGHDQNGRHDPSCCCPPWSQRRNSSLLQFKSENREAMFRNIITPGNWRTYLKGEALCPRHPPPGFPRPSPRSQEQAPPPSQQQQQQPPAGVQRDSNLVPAAIGRLAPASPRTQAPFARRCESCLFSARHWLCCLQCRETGILVLGGAWQDPVLTQ